MAKKMNARCPLQAECERKCEYEGHELDCDYYSVNAIGDRVIEDQEKIRRERERKRQEELDEERYLQMPDDDPDGPNIVYLPITELHPHPQNPRKEIGDVTELADSIRAKGVLQNLTVIRGHWMTPEEWQKYSAEYKENPTEELRCLLNSKWLDTEYTVIIGHRRRAGGKLAGLTHLPCAIVEMTIKEQVATMLLENMQRVDLTPYEQAQGFQMMIELGDTVEDIVEKTKFSRTTVKRRLEMARLDQRILKEVSDRQISMEDFDKLAKIDDMGKRNEVLKSIGTNNFAQSVQGAIKKQNIGKNLPGVKSALKEAKAKKIQLSQTWYGNYTEISGSEVQIDKLEGDLVVPQTDKKLYYCLEEDSGRLRFYTEREKAPPIKRPKAEIEREKAMHSANEQCKEITKNAYELRRQFIQQVHMTSKNKDVILHGAVNAGLVAALLWVSVSATPLADALGEKYDSSEACKRCIIEGVRAHPTHLVPLVIYNAFNDDDDEGYHSTYMQQFPKKKDNLRLDLLYEWLCALGYQMSDDEIAMQNGTHQLLNMGDTGSKE